MTRVVAPETFQESVDEFPHTIVEGDAAKLVMTGTGAGVTVTVRLAVELPEALVAVSV
jgi:hypothetical protein